ncbi:MAG: TonB-dependent receptor [Balneolaceae bacterium]|nr:TonB-dependent receptor [Balneolaceae bacterium]
MDTPPIAASYGSSADTRGGGSIFGDVFYTPRSIDLNGLPWENPVDNSSVYYRSGNDIQNPYWTLNNIKRTDNVDRLYGKTEVIYDIIDELSITYKLGLDTYSESQAYLRNAGGVNNPDLTGGYMHTRSIKSEIWDHNVYFNLSTQPTQEITVEGTVGAQFVLSKYETDGIGSTNQIIFDLFEHPNFTSPSATNGLSGAQFQYQEREETAGVFFDGTIGYNDWVYLSLSGRNDWFSTLEPDNRSIFYPSASISFIPTDAFQIGGDVLSYMKIRGGVGTSAGAPSPYNTRSSLSVNARDFLSGGVITTNAVSNTLGNPDLKAERLLEYEVGIESRFFNNQVGLEVTAYHRTTEDLITSADLDPATGYTNTLVNIGEIQNQGIEVSLDGSPVAGEFTWNTRWNFFAYESEVIDLGQDLSEIAVAGFTDLGNFAIEGEPLNVIKGTAIARDEQGRRLVNENGDYITSDEIEIIGDPNPDYTLSSINTFNFKNFSLTTQVDYQHGGDIYSTTIASLLARGITTDTGFDRQMPVILPGYRQITNDQGEVVNTIENNTQISATQAFFSNIGFGPDEVSMYDATNIRLSEVTLSYNLPASIVSRTPLQGISVSVSGFNLWYFTPNMPEGTNFDPNVTSTGADNGLGFDYLAGPSATRYGGSIQVQF